jgi:polar amino acid transport system ATP-binding protein
MVFQSFNLFPHKTVLENITLSPIQVHGKSKDEANAHAIQLLKRFDLADKADQYPDRLSGGQQQRVAIIRSLAVSPRLLLLDEVTSALDPVLVNEVLSAVRDLKSDGMTMILATHEMGFATQVADEVCFLESGNIVERGTAEQVLHNPQNPKTQEFLKRVHQAGRL